MCWRLFDLLSGRARRVSREPPLVVSIGGAEVEETLGDASDMERREEARTKIRRWKREDKMKIKRFKKREDSVKI